MSARDSRRIKSRLALYPLSLDKIGPLFIKGHNLSPHDSPILNRMDAYRRKSCEFFATQYGRLQKGWVWRFLIAPITD